VISVALETYLEIRLIICIYKTSLLHRPDDYIGFTPICAPHILQQNCAHALYYYIDQARRPDLTAGGTKNQKGATFKKYSIRCMQQLRGQTWNGGHRFQMGEPWTTGLPAGDGPDIEISNLRWYASGDFGGEFSFAGPSAILKLGPSRRFATTDATQINITRARYIQGKSCSNS